MRQPELVVNLNNMIGEGPVYDPQGNVLYWIDLLGNSIHAINLRDKSVFGMQAGQNTGCIALREKGGLVAGLQHGYYFVDMQGGTLEPICDPEADKPNNRFNDGKCDTKGRFWAGTMSKDLDSGYGEYRPDGSLYCMDTDLSVKCKKAGVILSNGIGWSPDDGTMYFIDTPTHTVAAFDYARETGDIANERTVVTVPEAMGMPDGMCVDDAGMLWVALWGGSAVSRWDPATGRLLEKVELPALNVSACTFGGENSDELFITTARIGTDTQKYPDAGGLYKIKPGVTGRACYKFKG